MRHTKSLARIAVAISVVVLWSAPLEAQPPTPFPGGGTLQQPMAWEFVYGTDFGVFRNPAPVGSTTAAVTPVAYGTLDSGCDRAHFTGFPIGNIALLSRGTCDFSVKLQNAELEGASGVLIANQPGFAGQPVVNGNLEGEGVNIPALSLSKALGDAFVVLAATGVQLTLQTHPSGPQTPPGQ